MKIYLIGCGKSKMQYACPAKEMYTGTLFQKSYAYAKAMHPDKIFILSAKYGLLDPELKIEPYDKTVKDFSAQQARKWADDVFTALEEKTDILNDEFVLLAGKDYYKYLIGRLNHCTLPLEGKKIGVRLHWLAEQLRAGNNK